VFHSFGITDGLQVIRAAAASDGQSGRGRSRRTIPPDVDPMPI
jgi:hypothetical protein